MTPWQWAALLLHGLLLVAGPHLCGGVHIGPRLMLCALALLCLGATLLALPRASSRLPLSYYGCVVLLAATGLQAVDLPCSLVAALDPGTADEARRAWALTSAEPLSSCALSMDPGATRMELLKWSAILAIFLSARLWALDGRHPQILGIVALSAGAMAMSSLLHTALRAQRVYGIYLPREVHDPALLSPLLNTNNLGGFLLLGLGAQLGFLRRESGGGPRVAIAVLSTITATTIVLSQSRGAAAALGLLAILFLLGELRRRRRRRSRRYRWPAALLPAATVLCGVLVALLCAGEPVSEALRDRDLTKFQLWQQSAPLVLLRPVLGIGRGAFSAVFTAVAGGKVRFAYPENVALQWAVEWGLPLSIALVAVVSALALAGLTMARVGLRFGAAAGMSAFLAQSMLDMGTEVLGVALLAAAVLGSVAGDRAGRSRESYWAFRPAHLWLASVGLLLWLGPDALKDDPATLREQLQQASEARDDEQLVETLRRGLRAHPREASLPYLAASLTFEANPGRAARWLNRALSLAPDWVGPHVLSARLLWRRGLRGQAAIELRRALAVDVDAARGPLCALASQAPELLETVLPDRGAPGRRRALTTAMACLPSGEVGTRLGDQLDSLLIAEFDEEQDAYVRKSRRLADRGQLDEAVRLLRSEIERAPNKDRLWRGWAMLLLAAGDVVGAGRVLDRATQQLGSSAGPAILLTQAEIFAHLGDADQMRKRWAEARGKSPTDPDSLANLYRHLGGFEERVGDRERALSAYIQAHRLSGKLPELQRAASLAEAMGDRAQAYRWWRRACALFPDSREACAAAERLGPAGGAPGARPAP